MTISARVALSKQLALTKIIYVIFKKKIEAKLWKKLLKKLTLKNWKNLIHFLILQKHIHPKKISLQSLGYRAARKTKDKS